MSALSLMTKTIEDTILKCMEAKERVGLRMFIEGLRPQDGWTIGCIHEHTSDLAIVYLPARGQVGEQAETRPDMAIRVTINYLIEPKEMPKK